MQVDEYLNNKCFVARMNAVSSNILYYTNASVVCVAQFVLAQNTHGTQQVPQSVSRSALTPVSALAHTRLLISVGAGEKIIPCVCAQ